MCFSSIFFSINFLRKTRPKLVDEENGLKKCLNFLFLFIKRILYRAEFVFLLFFFFDFFVLFCDMPLLKGSSVKYIRSDFIILDQPPPPVRIHTLLVYTPSPSTSVRIV